MPTPFVGFSNATLARQPRVNVGDAIACPHCGARHALEPADTGGDLLLFYRCGGGAFLGAVDGRSVIGVKADMAGEV